MMERQQALADVRAAPIPTSRPWRRSSAPTAPTPPPTAAASRSRSSRATSARPTPSEIIARLQPQLAAVAGITLYLQPVQDLQIDNRAVAARSTSTRSRTPTPPSSRAWAPQAARRSCATLPELRDVASRPADRRARSCTLTIDRDTAVAPRRHAAGDRRHALRRLRPAHRLDHLHAAQPVPRHPRGAARGSADARTRSTRIYVRSATGDAGAALGVRALRDRARAARRSSHQGQFPSVTLSFNTAPGVSLGDAVDAIDARRGRASACRPACTPSSRARRRRSASRSRREPLLHPRRAAHRLHRARRALRELHPPDHDPVDAAVGGRRRAPRAHRVPAREFDVIALIGIILLDRHREEERDHDDRLRARGGARAGHVARARRSTRRACCASGRS